MMQGGCQRVEAGRTGGGYCGGDLVSSGYRCQGAVKPRPLTVRGRVAGLRRHLGLVPELAPVAAVLDILEPYGDSDRISLNREAVGRQLDRHRRAGVQGFLSLKVVARVELQITQSIRHISTQVVAGHHCQACPHAILSHGSGKARQCLDPSLQSILGEIQIEQRRQAAQRSRDGPRQLVDG